MTLESIENEFLSLRDKWRRETSLISNINKILSHPSYLAIIALGPAVVPFIIRDLKINGCGHWYLALEILTGHKHSINTPGRMDIHAEEWIKWWDTTMSRIPQ